MDSDRIDRISLLNNSYLINFLRFSPIKLTNELDNQIIESYINRKVYDDLVNDGFPSRYSIRLYPKRLKNTLGVNDRAIIDNDLYEQIHTRAMNINKSIAVDTIRKVLSDSIAEKIVNVNVIYPNNYLLLGCYINRAYFNPNSPIFKCDIDTSRKLDVMPWASKIIIELDIQHKELNRLKLNNRFFFDYIYRDSYINTPITEILSPCNEVYLDQE
ncbi:hypothetical protein PBI_SCTP2_495 [Salicola phage SCTP-2]|nr:hypothetical protein PBI_SCTP2_495 [Salicola phage SCTP-2]